MKKTAYILFFSTLFLSLIVGAQQPSKSDLEKRRTALLKEIEATQKQLAETKQDKTTTLAELKALQAKLNARQQLIGSINSEITTLESNIKVSNHDIEQLNKNLEEQKRRYAQSIRYAYKHKETENFVLFLINANDFNDALRRMAYLKRYNEFRKTEADKIIGTQQALASKVNTLNLQKEEKSHLLTTEESQKKEILAEKEQTDQLVKSLKGKENELLAQIKKNKAASDKINASIKEMIRKEMEIAKKKAAEEAKRKAAQEALAKKQAEDARKKAEADALAKANANSGPGLNTGSTSTRTSGTKPTTSASNTSSTTATATTNPSEPKTKPNTTNTDVLASRNTEPKTSGSDPYKMGLTPEVQSISNSFGANQGRLPWPVEKGYISSQYGKQPHPLYPNVELENLGIEITTGANAAVRSVFEGTVTKITNIDGVVIMVSHGEYFTIYSGLASASVKQGDKIKAKQTIGVVGKNENGENLVNFQVWKISGNNFNTVNPSSWIAR